MKIITVIKGRAVTDRTINGELVEFGRQDHIDVVHALNRGCTGKNLLQVEVGDETARWRATETSHLPEIYCENIKDPTKKKFIKKSNFKKVWLKSLTPSNTSESEEVRFSLC